MKIDYEVLIAWVVVGMFIVLVGIGTVATIDKAYHHYQETHAQEERETRVWPPAIPSCNKELFKRIEDGCEHEGD